MSKLLERQIHDTLMKVMHMQGGARIGVGGALAGGRRKKKGGIGVGGRKKKMRAGVLMDDLMHPNYYAQKKGGVGVGGRKRKGGASRGMKGAAKHANPWVSHVKKYARAHGMSYGDAMSAARASYRG